MFARSNRLFNRVSRTATIGAKRRMGGHAPPPTDGLDGAVRKYLKEDWQLVLGVLGVYTGLFFVYKLVNLGKKKEAAPAATTAVSVSSGSMPSVDSAEFGEWVAKDGNLEKMLTA